MNSTKVLYVASANDLFLNMPPLSNHVEALTNATTISPDYETRLLLPRFGVIKERQNNIYETNRLTGINIPMGKNRISLVVKVPSVRGVKLPIYFVDNEELFERKGVFTDAKGNFYDDNHVRALFFSKSILAIVEKLSWIPDIIHCHGWMSAFIPAFLKKAYTESHPLHHTKSLYTLYEDEFEHTFPEEMLKIMRYKQLKASDVEEDLTPEINYSTLTNMAIRHADCTTRIFDKPTHDSWKKIPYQEAQYAPDNEAAGQTYLDIYKSMQEK